MLRRPSSLSDCTCSTLQARYSCYGLHMPHVRQYVKRVNGWDGASTGSQVIMAMSAAQARMNCDLFQEGVEGDAAVQARKAVHGKFKSNAGLGRTVIFLRKESRETPLYMRA